MLSGEEWEVFQEFWKSVDVRIYVNADLSLLLSKALNKKKIPHSLRKPVHYLRELTGTKMKKKIIQIMSPSKSKEYNIRSMCIYIYFKSYQK